MIALEQFFIAFQKFRLRLNLEKCTFLTTKGKYLSHHKQWRIPSQPWICSHIDEMKHPTMEKELQCVIRHLVWIQQFFDNPSTQTNLNRQVLHPDGPLYTNLTGSVNYLSGLKERIRPLKNIKKCFSSPMISFSNFTGLFTLTTDTSDITCRAILMQETKNGWKMIIAVISYFQPMGHNWSITDWSICYKMGHI